MGLRNRQYLVEYENATVVGTGELPVSLQKALRGIGFRKKDIRIIPSTSARIGSSAGDGRRGIAMAVNMENGRTSELQRGSWGGANPFEKKPVDWVDGPVKIPPNGAVIVGSEGGRGVWAQIYVHPSQLALLLPGDTRVSEREADILRMAGYTSKYKKDLFRRHRVTVDEIRKLVDGGYMKMNKAGATSLTPSGKNAMSKKNL